MSSTEAVPLTAGDHDVSAWADMLQDLGRPRADAERILQVAINRGLIPAARIADPGGLRELAESWAAEARRRMNDESRKFDPTNLVAAGINQAHADELRRALAPSPTAPERQHNPSNHDCKGGVEGDRYGF